MSRELSQRVSGNGVDRFRFKIGTTGKGIGENLYYGRLRLIYNDGESVMSKPFIALIPRPSTAIAWASPPDGLGDPEFRRCWERKARDLEQILRQPGVRSKKTRAYARFPGELRKELRAFDAREKRDRERWDREFAVRGVRPREFKLGRGSLGLLVDGATAWVSSGPTNKLARLDLDSGTATALIKLKWPVPLAVAGSELWVLTGAGCRRRTRRGRRSRLEPCATGETSPRLPGALCSPPGVVPLCGYR